jgi:hypothetical protein
LFFSLRITINLAIEGDTISTALRMSCEFFSSTGSSRSSQWYLYQPEIALPHTRIAFRRRLDWTGSLRTAQVIRTSART